MLNLVSKKIFFSAILILVFVVLLGVFFGLQNKKHKIAQNSKAPEITLTIVEGWNVEEIAEYLEQQKVAQKKEFLETVKKFNLSKYPLLESKPKYTDLEGFLFPDTYRIFSPSSSLSPTKNSPSEQLVGKMLDNFSQKFTVGMEQQAKKLRMSVYEILTLASIVEKETGRNAVSKEQKIQLDTERKIVAGIFYNRLNLGMALESDATINYITKKYDPTPSLSDLNTESHFNTYRNKGLPPTPICNPSLSSILAVLYPEKTDFFYFLHKQPSGEVVFSKTFDEHVKNKLKYLK